MILRKCAACVAAVLFSGVGAESVLAAPTINSVLQPADNPSKLIITGSGFTNKSHPGPLYFFNFDDGSLAQDASSLVKTAVTTNGSLASETTPTDSGRALKFKIQQASSALAIPEIDFDSDQLYVYFHRRYSFSIGDSSTWGSLGFNLKTNRLWGDDQNNIYIGYQGKEGANSGRIYPEYTATGGSVWTGNNLPQVANKWSQEEIVYQASDINSKNGRFDLIRDGDSVHSKTFRMRTSDRPDKYDQLVFDQISNGTNSSRDLYIYYDNIYIDDSFHRVYMSESPTFSGAKSRLIQVPTKWSDNNIEIDFNSGKMPLNGIYVYVVDAQGNVNSNGVRVCQDDCPAPPKPPGSVAVN